MSAWKSFAAQWVASATECDALSPRAARAVVLAGALAVVAALTVHWLLRPDFNKNSVDGFYFATLAQHLAEGRGYMIGAFPQTLYFPLYPLAVAAAFRVVGDAEVAAHLVNMASLLALTWLAFLFLRRLLGRNDLAAVGALFGATSPSVVYFGSLMISEALFGALLLGASLAALALSERAPDRGDFWRFAGLGALGAALFLTRPEAIGYLAALVAYLAVRRRRFGDIIRWAAAAATFAACVAPWAVHESRAAGGWSVAGKSSLNLDIGAARGRDREVNVATICNAPAPDGRGVRYEEPEKFARVGALAENLRIYPRQLAEHLQRLARLVGFALPLLPFGVVFFLARGRAGQLALPLMLAAVQLVIPFYFSEPRFVMPAVPFFVAVEIAGAAQIAALFARRRPNAPAGRGRSVAAAALLLAALLAPTSWQHYRSFFRRNEAFDRQQREIRQFAAELQRAHPEIGGRPLIAYRPWLAFRLGAVHREMPYFTSAERLPPYMAANDIPYLLLSQMGANDLSAGFAQIAAAPAAFGLAPVAAGGTMLLLRRDAAAPAAIHPPNR